jgi:hypothetical protein
MSKVAVSGNASGTGVVTLAAPNTNDNVTLNLPSSAGTLATSASVLSQFNASGSAPVYACRAWVNFNGTGTVAIRASGNVSSITDNGTGDYTVNFTTAMPDANYAITSEYQSDYPIFSGSISARVKFISSQAAGNCRLVMGYQASGSGYTDSAIVCVAIFR